MESIPNVFQIIDARLSLIEELLIDIKHKRNEQSRLADNEQTGTRITKKQAAALINCSVSTIDNARRAGKIKAYRIGAKAVRFEKSEVLNLAKQ